MDDVLLRSFGSALLEPEDKIILERTLVKFLDRAVGGGPAGRSLVS
jgi:hypothetical protein